MKENTVRRIIIVALVIIVSFVLGFTVFEFGLKEQPKEPEVETNTEVEQKVENIDVVNYYLSFDGYQDIRQLPQEYTIEQATQDNCFVVMPFEKKNENVYQDFIDKVTNGISSNLRVVKPTDEGDISIIDIKYNSEINNFVIAIDDTRDRYSGGSGITIRSFEHVGEYYFSESLKCFVVYNGELTDENYASNNTFVIAIL